MVFLVISRFFYREQYRDEYSCPCVLFLQTSGFPLDLHSRVRLLDHEACGWSALRDSIRLFPKLSHQFTFYIFLNSWYFRLLNFFHLKKFKMVSQCDLDITFPNHNYELWTAYMLIGQISFLIHVSAHFLIRLFMLYLLICYCHLYIISPDCSQVCVLKIPSLSNFSLFKG